MTFCEAARALGGGVEAKLDDGTKLIVLAFEPLYYGITKIEAQPPGGEAEVLEGRQRECS